MCHTPGYTLVDSYTTLVGLYMGILEKEEPWKWNSGLRVVAVPPSGCVFPDVPSLCRVPCHGLKGPGYRCISALPNLRGGELLGHVAGLLSRVFTPQPGRVIAALLFVYT